MERRPWQREPLQQWQLRGGRGEEGEGRPPPLPETVCPHKNTLDDYDVADVVCMDCGLVLDRLLGGGGGGQRTGGGGGWYENVSGHRDAETFCTTTLLSREERERMRVRDTIVRCLSNFQMDTEEVVRLALENYWKIYGGRKSGKAGFRKDGDKERVAIAFSVCNTLARQGIPRPPGYVASVCGMPPEEHSKLLKIPSVLALGKEELRQLRRSDYELQESEAEDYIDILCAILGVPFHFAGRIRSTAERITWYLHGRLPTVLAAASMQLELGRAGHLREDRVSAKTICELLDCKQKTVSGAIRDFIRLKKEEEEENDSAEEGEGEKEGVDTQGADVGSGEIDDEEARSRRGEDDATASGGAPAWRTRCNGTNSHRTDPGGDHVPRVEEDTAAGRCSPAAPAGREIRLADSGSYEEEASETAEVGVQPATKTGAGDHQEGENALAALAALSQLLELWPTATEGGGEGVAESDGAGFSVSEQEMMDI